MNIPNRHKVEVPKFHRNKKMRLKTTWILFILLLAIISLVYHVIFNYIFAFSTTRYKLVENWKAENRNSSRIHVLFWTKFFSLSQWDMNKDTIDSDDPLFKSLDCPVSNCIFTNNKSFLSAPHLYDALVFHAPEPFLSPLPDTRSTNQFYIMASME